MKTNDSPGAITGSYRVQYKHWKYFRGSKIDADGNTYITDYHNHITKIAPNGVVTHNVENTIEFQKIRFETLLSAQEVKSKVEKLEAAIIEKQKAKKDSKFLEEELRQLTYVEYPSRGIQDILANRVDLARAKTVILREGIWYDRIVKELNLDSEEIEKLQNILMEELGYFVKPTRNFVDLLMC